MSSDQIWEVLRFSALGYPRACTRDVCFVNERGSEVIYLYILFPLVELVHAATPVDSCNFECP